MVTILVVSMVVINSRENDATSSTSDSPKSIPVLVKTVEVRLSDFTPVLNTTGQIHAKNKVEIYADVTGTLLKTPSPFKAGNSFKTGQILLKIDSREKQLAVESSKADFFGQLIALLPDIQNDFPESYNAWKTYIENYSTTRPIARLPEPHSEKEKYFLASRKVDFHYLSIKSSEVNLGKYTIVAPFDGVILQGDQNPGGLVRNGQKLGEIMQVGIFEVHMDVAVDRLNAITIGSPVSIGLPSGSQPVKSKITRIGKAVDKSTQTVTLYAEIRNPNNLIDGLWVDVRIALPEIRNTFRIDRNYLTENGDLLQVDAGKLRFLSPGIAAFQENQAILTGIPQGTHIVNQLLPGAFPGMRVKKAGDVSR